MTIDTVRAAGQEPARTSPGPMAIPLIKYRLSVTEPINHNGRMIARRAAGDGAGHAMLDN